MTILEENLSENRTSFWIEWLNGQRELRYLRWYKKELSFLANRLEGMWYHSPDKETTPDELIDVREKHQMTMEEIKAIKLEKGFIPLLKRRLHMG